MREIIELLSRFLFTGLNSLETLKGLVFIRLMANLTAFFLMVFGYVLGCKALYYYLNSYGGEIFSLRVMGALLFTTSLLLFIMVWLLKPKPLPSTNLISIFERILKETTSHEAIKKISSVVPFKTFIPIFTIAAIYSYFISHKKENTDI
jgi:hypothetical protein